jgi:hypothetical protein
LTAATVSQAADRLDKLRAAAVREVSLFLPLVKRLEVELLPVSTVADLRLSDGPSIADAVVTVPVAGLSSVAVSDDERRAVLLLLLEQLWAHTGVLISGSRADELRAIAEGQDELIQFIQVRVLQS